MLISNGVCESVIYLVIDMGLMGILIFSVFLLVLKCVIKFWCWCWCWKIFICWVLNKLSIIGFNKLYVFNNDEWLLRMCFMFVKSGGWGVFIIII